MTGGQEVDDRPRFFVVALLYSYQLSFHGNKLSASAVFCGRWTDRCVRVCMCDLIQEYINPLPKQFCIYTHPLTISSGL